MGEMPVLSETMGQEIPDSELKMRKSERKWKCQKVNMSSKEGLHKDVIPCSSKCEIELKFAV